MRIVVISIQHYMSKSTIHGQTISDGHETTSNDQDSSINLKKRAIEKMPYNVIKIYLVVVMPWKGCIYS